MSDFPLLTTPSDMMDERRYNSEHKVNLKFNNSLIRYDAHNGETIYLQVLEVTGMRLLVQELKLGSLAEKYTVDSADKRINVSTPPLGWVQKNRSTDIRYCHWRYYERISGSSYRLGLCKHNTLVLQAAVGGTHGMYWNGPENFLDISRIMSPRLSWGDAIKHGGTPHRKFLLLPMDESPDGHMCLYYKKTRIGVIHRRTKTLILGDSILSMKSMQKLQAVFEREGYNVR